MIGRRKVIAPVAALVISVAGVAAVTSAHAAASTVSRHEVRGDFNGDGYADLAETVASNSIDVLLNDAKW